MLVLMRVVPETDNVFRPVILSLASAALPKTALPLTVSANWPAPFTAPPVVTAVPASVISAAKLRAALYSCVPVAVVTLPDKESEPDGAKTPVFITTLPASIVLLAVTRPLLVSERAPSGATEPTFFAKETLPEPEFSERLAADPSPSTSSAKLMLPFAEDMLRLPATTTALAKLMFAAVVEISPDSRFAPAPVWAKPPLAVISPAAAVVN